MAPRRYRLTTRAASAAATRERVIRAAAAEYRESGVATSSIGAIAARAGVSRGTVVHHFGDAGGLLGAVLDDVVVALEVPGAQLLEGARDSEDRARRFVEAMVRFYDRTSDWWTVFGSAIDHPVVQAREVAFWELIAGFRSAAFGSAANDRLVVAVVDAVTHPATLGTLRAGGLSLDETIVVTGDLVVDLLRRQRLAGP